MSQIIVNVSLSASNSNLPASSAMKEFTILKAFNVSINPPKLLFVKEVFGALLLLVGSKETVMAPLLLVRPLAVQFLGTVLVIFWVVLLKG